MRDVFLANVQAKFTPPRSVNSKQLDTVRASSDAPVVYYTMSKMYRQDEMAKCGKYDSAGLESVIETRRVANVENGKK